MAAETFETSAGLQVHVDADRLRIAWGEPDWFGPAERIAADGVALDAHVDPVDDLVVLTVTATRDLAGFGTGELTAVSAGWRFEPTARLDGGAPEGARAFGFQYTEFALPTHSDATLGRWWLLPFRPNIVEPLGLIGPDGRTVLLAPLDTFHEQVIVVPRADDDDRGVRWGWHGDLDEIPDGFTSSLAVLAAPSPRAALDRLGAVLARRSGTVRPPAARDQLGSRLSYWTDNGAAYWYRTEPGRDVPTTIVDTVADLRARHIPVGPVQLDSWFYPHEVLRPFDTDEWEVPPTGLLTWEARGDVLPDGIPALRSALGNPPLVTHCRHVSSASPYVDEHECWVDGDRAHPVDVSLYERWLDQAQAWGVEVFEHDWLIECFLGVRGLRAAPGRARAWQEGLDRAAGERGITLQWCMASPPDMLQTTTLRNVTSVRTSGDFGYLVGPGMLWAWFLAGNGLARALGLRPFKDVFHADPTDLARHCDVEALLSALSTGPVGVGDRLGVADASIVLRTCRADGTLVRPDVALAATSATYVANPVVRSVPLIAEAWTDHAAGRWSYVVALNCHDDGDAVAAAVAPGELGASAPDGPHVRYDWRTGAMQRCAGDDDWSFSLDPLAWSFVVAAPILPCGVAIVGDPSRYATAGKTRIAAVDDDGDRVRLAVLGAGEVVTIVGWSDGRAVTARRWQAADGWEPLAVQEGDAPGSWSVDVAVGATGRADVEITPE